MKEDALIDLGFSKNEASVLSLLRLGLVQRGIIVAKSNIKNKCMMH